MVKKKIGKKRLAEEKKIRKKMEKKFPKKGEIWWVKLPNQPFDPHQPRTAIIVSRDSRNAICSTSSLRLPMVVKSARRRVRSRTNRHSSVAVARRGALPGRVTMIRGRPPGSTPRRCGRRSPLPAAPSPPASETAARRSLSLPWSATSAGDPTR